MASNDDKYFDINIDAGSDFSLSFTIYESGSTPVDLTGAVVTAVLREYPEGDVETLFTAMHNNDGGQITIMMPHETTASIGYSYGWYSVSVTFPNSSIMEVLHGKAFVVAGVTRIISHGVINQIVAFSDFDEFPDEGNIYRIYLDQNTSDLYWWNGSQYISLSYAMRGAAATIRVGTVTTLPAGSQATVRNIGTTSAAVFDFGIPKGDQGEAATITVGTVSSVPTGQPATVTNVGTETDAIFNFGLPKGETGFVMYPNFDVDLNSGDLLLNTETDLTNATFSLSEDGELQVTI